MVHGFNQAALRTGNFQNLAILDFSRFSCVLEHVSDVTTSEF